MLSTRDLDVMMMQDPVASSTFLGVFASNELPSKIPTFPSGLIANTDPNTKAGQHWVAMYFPDVNKKEFFDSYGFPPNYYTTRFTKFLASHPGDTEHNVGTLQALNSNVCGYYCMFYLFHRGRRQDLKSIVKFFSLDNRQANDRHVVQFVKSVFGQKPLPKTFHESCVECNVSRRQVQGCICYGYE